MGALKRLLLGRPIPTEQAGHQLLPVALALPVFASDALSSNAYATEEILHVLLLAGPGALSWALPIAGAVIGLMLIVVTSYRQTVRAYPRGGGGYLVTQENVGTVPSLLAAGALLAAYVLTVAVSMAASAFAVASFAPSLLDHRVAMALIFLVLITVMNLRGAKESGTLFAVPTYAFIVAIVTMIVMGTVKCFASACPQATGAETIHHAVQPLTLGLLLRAFASGATALTGVEAIADGVGAFRGRRPSEQAKNASRTLGLLFVLSSIMFFGITFLANKMHVVPTERSVVANMADATFGGGFGFAAVQIATAMILFLAANTAYQDFPRLSSILAKDRFMPRQFINRGDRLVFSNGIVVLSVLSALLIVLFEANVSRLIPLYLVGVFTTFTLAQTGMVMRWIRRREQNWQRNMVLNGVGMITTAVVLLVVIRYRFVDGAWMMMLAIPLIAFWFLTVNRHYASVSRQLRLPEHRPVRLRGTRVVVLVARTDEATMRAIGYARALRPLEVRAVHIGRGEEARLMKASWDERRLPLELDIVDGDPDDFIAPVRSYIRAMAAANEDEFITVVVPEVLRKSGWRQFVRRRRALLLKAALLFERRVALTDVPVVTGNTFTTTQGAIAPTRTIALVLVSAVHNATLQAVEYARSLSPTELRAVTFNVDPDETMRVLSDWGTAVDDISLEAVDSPYREVVRPLVRYATRLRSQHPDAVISVIVPEFVVRKWWHQFLHNQTALAIKASLLFESRVVVTSVPFHLK